MLASRARPSTASLRARFTDITRLWQPTRVRAETREQTLAPGHPLIRRVRLIIFVGALVMTGLLAAGLFELVDARLSGLMSLVFIASAWALYHLNAQYVRAETERQYRLEVSARVEGLRLAARTLRHHLANRLGVTVAHIEILADDPRLPEDLVQHAQQAIASVKAAVEVVDKFDGEIVRAQLDSTVAGPLLLDIDSSITADTDTANPPSP
jgi:hypothetical protein